MQHIFEFVKLSHSLDNIFSKRIFLFTTCYYSLRNEMRKPSFGTWRLQNVRNTIQFISMSKNSHENIANRPTYLLTCMNLLATYLVCDFDYRGQQQGKYIIIYLCYCILNQSRLNSYLLICNILVMSFLYNCFLLHVI